MTTYMFYMSYPQFHPQLDRYRHDWIRFGINILLVWKKTTDSIVGVGTDTRSYPTFGGVHITSVFWFVCHLTLFRRQWKIFSTTSISFVRLFVFRSFIAMELYLLLSLLKCKKLRACSYFLCFDDTHVQFPSLKNHTKQ